MPHHYGSNTQSTSKRSTSRPNPHTPSGTSKSTYVAPGKSAPISKKKTGGGPLIIQAIRAVGGSGVKVISIKDVTPVAHNGVRPKKPRRV